MSEPGPVIDERFYTQLGKAVGAWSFIETMLCNHFSMVTQMPPHVAKAVFYSARSLGGRTDMLAGAIQAQVSAVDHPSYVPFLKVALNRVGTWASTRNMLAHSRVYGTTPESGHAHLGAHFMADALEDLTAMKKPLTLPDLEVATYNFGRLACLLMVSHNPPPERPAQTTFRECHELAQALPTKATDPERSPKVRARFARLIPDGKYQGAI